MRYRAAALSLLALVLVGSLFLSAPLAQTTSDENVVFSKDYKVGWIHLLLAYDSFSSPENETAMLRITRLRTDKDLRGGLLRFNSDWISGFRDFVRSDEEVYEQEVSLKGSGSNTIYLYLRGDKNSSIRIEVVTRHEVPAPTASLTSSAESITYGDSLELSWTTENAESITIEPGLGAVDASGNATVSPAEDTTYTLTATGPGGEAQASVSVDVRSAVESQPKGSFGENYEDLVPPDAEIEAYDPDRFAVVTGFVNDIAGTPLSGVEVTVHNDEALYGTARTEETGRFAIPVEGGGLVTVNYHKDGYIDAHRQANVPWNDFAMTETVALIVEDTVTTTVVPDGNPAHSTTHRSSVISDKDGTRAATVVFPGDVKAYRVEDNGTETELTSFTVRVTEYPTPESMPAVLPPTSAFTWCGEFTVDGAEHVRFDKPVVGWLENFLDFPVGAIVPSGYYDREKAVWVPTENGLVVELLDTDSDGIVDALDATGDGVADDIDGDGVLGDEVLGLEDASVYAPGATFWRVRMEHFTSYDLNHMAGNPNEMPYNGEPQVDECPTGDCEDSGIASSVNYKSGRLNEEAEIAGGNSDLQLHYSSGKVGAKVWIPLTGKEVNENLTGITACIQVAGRYFEYNFEPIPNQIFEFTWDGLDFRGQSVGGQFIAQIKIKYEADIVYSVKQVQSVDDAYVERLFGVTFNAQLSMERLNNSLYRFTQVSKKSPILTNIPSTSKGLGKGWSIDAQATLNHNYWGNWILTKGDGTIVKSKNLSLSEDAEVFAGIYAPDVPSPIGNDGKNATDVCFGYISSIDSSPNGSLLVMANRCLYRIDTDGIVHVIAGYASDATWDPYFYTDFADGILASAMPIPGGASVLEANGHVYLYWSYGGGRIVRIEKDGTVSIIAGTYGYFGGYRDGAVARNYTFNELGDVVIGDNGFIYFIEGRSRVRFITPDGRIHTLAGGGTVEPVNVLGTQAALEGLEGLYVDEAGNVYTSSYGDILVIDKTGVIRPLIDEPEDIDYLLSADKTITPGGKNLYIGEYGKLIMVIAPPDGDPQFLGTVYTGDDGFGYAFDEETNLHVATIDYRTGNVIRRFEYDGQGKLIRIIDLFGNVLSIERDGSGNATKIISPDGHETTLQIDANGDLVSVGYPDGGVAQFEYDDQHHMTSKTEPEGNRFEFSYDDRHKIVLVTDEEGGSWSYNRYFDNGTAVYERTTAEGQTMTYRDYQNATGFYSEIIDPSEGVTSYAKLEYRSRTWDRIKNLPCGTQYNSTMRMDWVTNKIMPQAVVTTVPSGKQSVMTRYSNIVDEDHNGVPDKITENVSVDGRRTTQVTDTWLGLITTTTPSGRTTTEEYDTATLLTSRTSVPGLYDTTYEYDARGRVTQIATGNRTVAYTYGNQGNVATVTDAQNRTTSYTYDAMDRVTSVTGPDETTVRFAWDKNGNLDVLTVPSNVDHGFEYNKVDKNTAYDPPISPSYQYEYDRDRRLVRTVFPSGAAIENVYENGQLRRIKMPEGDVVMDYLCSSKIGTITMGTEFLNFEYDGPLVTSQEQAGELNALLTFGYDDTMRLESFGYAGGTTTFGYDLDGLPTTIGDFTIERDADNGLPLAVDDGAARLDREFNGYGEVDSWDLTVVENDVASFDLTRNNLGQIVARNEIIAGVSHQYEYTYDVLGRLLTVTRDGSVVEQYAYDNANGARSSETNALRNIVGREYASDDEDHLLTAGNATFSYNADGFLTEEVVGSQETRYTYSSRGELKRVELPDGRVVEYEHDPLGRRIAKKIDGQVVEKYLWQGRTRLLAVYDASDTVLMRFEYAGDRLPVRMIKESQAYYLAYDQVGTLRAVFDAEGAVVKTVEYDSFGNVIADSAPEFAVPFGFAGGLHDRDTGLARFGHRDYDPDTGRWMAKDPIGFEGSKYCLYGYVENDPVNLVDPWGLYTEVIQWGRSPGRAGRWGHISGNINGQNWSFGPGGWDTKYPNFSDYAERQADPDIDRGGRGIVLDLSPAEEAQLQQCLQSYDDYNGITNNCGNPWVKCLEKLGVADSSDKARILPYDIYRIISASPRANGSTNYPGTHKPVGAN